MNWADIIRQARLIKETFDRSYKCLNIDRDTREETVSKHFKILKQSVKKIQVLFNIYYDNLTTAHKAAADGFYGDIREKFLYVASKKGIDITIPIYLHEKLNIELNETQEDNKVDKTLEDNKIRTEDVIITDDNMAQTVIEFLNTATKLIPDFDGKHENLKSFLDALSLVDALKGTHEAVAITLIKTKLKGNARNLINNESTIQQVIAKLTSSVKGESVEVLSAKILNIKQNNKTANAYCDEIGILTKSLENAYISDGSSCEIAEKYSTQVAVRAMTKNCNNDTVKIIMKAGQFATMNEAIEKFVSSCTNASVRQNTILYSNRRQNNNYYRGNKRPYHGRGGYGNQDNSRYRNHNNNNNRGRRGQHFYRGNSYRGNNRNDIRMITNGDISSENPNSPLR